MPLSLFNRPVDGRMEFETETESQRGTGSLSIAKKKKKDTLLTQQEMSLVKSQLSVSMFWRLRVVPFTTSGKDQRDGVLGKHEATHYPSGSHLNKRVLRRSAEWRRQTVSLDA